MSCYISCDYHHYIVKSLLVDDFVESSGIELLHVIRRTFWDLKVAFILAAILQVNPY